MVDASNIFTHKIRIGGFIGARTSYGCPFIYMAALSAILTFKGIHRSPVGALKNASNAQVWCVLSQIAEFMGPTRGLPGSCRPQMGPMLAPWTLLSGLMLAWTTTGCQWYMYAVMCDVIIWRNSLVECLIQYTLAVDFNDAVFSNLQMTMSIFCSISCRADGLFSHKNIIWN